MGERDLEQKSGAPAQANGKSADNTNGNGNGAHAAPPRRTMLAVLILAGMVIGSASAAVVVASVIMRPAAAVAGQTEGPTAEKSKDAMPGRYELDGSLIVNVYQTQQRRYLSVKPVFTTENKEAAAVLSKRQAELHHLLISILKAKTLEQLDDPDAANSIGREVQEMVNLKFSLGSGVTGVQFTQFVVQ